MISPKKIRPGLRVHFGDARVRACVAVGLLAVFSASVFITGNITTEGHTTFAASTENSVTLCSVAQTELERLLSLRRAAEQATSAAELSDIALALARNNLTAFRYKPGESLPTETSTLPSEWEEIFGKITTSPQQTRPLSTTTDYSVGNRPVARPNVDTTRTMCISGPSVTLRESGAYRGCGPIGKLTISGADILVQNIQAQSVVIQNAQRVLVSDSTIANGSGSLVSIAESRDVTLENNELRDIVGIAINVYPQRVVGLAIRNNLISGVRRSGAGEVGSDPGGGIILGHSYQDSLPSVHPNLVVEGNRFERFDQYGDNMGAIHIKTNDVVVQNNFVDAAGAWIAVRHGRNAKIISNTMTQQTEGIRIMGDNHEVRDNQVPRIAIMAGNTTMDDFDGDPPYPVARNIQLSGNSVAPQVVCWGNCPLNPTFVVEDAL
ncbi:MAG: hypothetical protein KatS3mg100_231 [Candidatus Parcubacteria bacterium]|nr:MAG: hypothetical protein KatS3mg100_231 [Candidatus Parcubacteria bacterium]